MLEELGYTGGDNSPVLASCLTLSLSLDYWVVVVVLLLRI
jgi:hypothetical protein